MFNYTKAELAEKAKELNFVRDTLEKVVRLTETLDYISSNPIMQNHLALKGGTAINLTVFRLPRLSIDIDLDYCAVYEIHTKEVNTHVPVYGQLFFMHTDKKWLKLL